MSETITPATSVAIREPHYERVGLQGLGASGGVLAINSMAEAVSVAQLMAKSGIAIRKHLRDQPGACLGVLMQALRWEMDPYMVGNKSYAVNDQLAYEAQLIAAVVLTRAAIVDEPDYIYEGEAGTTRTCTVAFKMRSGKVLAYTTPEVKKITTKNSPLWKSDEDQQLGYFAVRSWARRHQPHVLLGVYTVEEAAEVIDITPGTSGVASRLPGAQTGNGFSREGVEAEGEKAAPKAARASRKPRAPADEAEEPTHEISEAEPTKAPEVQIAEAKEAAELVGVVPTTAEAPTDPATAPTAESEPATPASAEPAAEALPDQAASSPATASPPTNAGLDAADEAEVAEIERFTAEAENNDLPAELQTLITATETVGSWDEVKAAMGAFQKGTLWPTLSPAQQNHIRASTWETLADRNVEWLPDHHHDLSAFRLWVEAQDAVDEIRAALALLQADPGFQAKGETMRLTIAAAASDRIKALEE